MYNDFRVLEPWWLLLLHTHMLHGEHMQHTERFYMKTYKRCSMRNHLHRVLVAMQLSECSIFLRVDLKEMTVLCQYSTTTQQKFIYL